MRVLVTGANGHVGSNLVRELVSRGHTPVPFVRRTSDIAGLSDLGLELRYGDVRDRASLLAAAEGCDAIEHLAAVYAFRISDPAEILRPALEGTTNVLEVAAERGIRRVVITSSITALGFNRRPDAPLRTEADWNEAPESPYFQAKTESERQAWQLAGKLGVELVTVLPGGVLGPHDYRITPSTAFIRNAANGKTITAPGGMSYVDARDVALVHAVALERGTPGERYIIGGENLHLWQVAALVAEVTGKKTMHLGVPRWMALSSVAMQSTVERWIGREPTLTVEDVTEVANRWGFVDSSKAERAFGYTPRKGARMVEDTLTWLAQRDALEPAVKARVLAHAARAT